HVFGPAVGLWIEAHHPARVHLAGPDFPVLVRQALVERDAKRRRAVFRELPRLRIELHQQTACAAEPGIAVWVEAAALGRRARRARLQLEHFALFDVEESDPVLRPGAAGEEFAVG